MAGTQVDPLKNLKGNRVIRVSGGVTVPDSDFDVDAGYMNGDFIVLDSGAVYQCIDNSAGSALWLWYDFYTREQIDGMLDGLNGVYAPIAKGVTNGDSHDHSGGDGGTIAYSSLSGTPTIPTLASGTWTPTGTAIANVDSIATVVCFYTRVGDIVSASGRLAVDSTTAGVQTRVRFTLPVASAIGAVDDVIGVCTQNTDNVAGIILGFNPNEAEMRFTPASAVNRSYYFEFKYKVL